MTSHPWSSLYSEVSDRVAYASRPEGFQALYARRSFVSSGRIVHDV
jgi:hypothetical protein